ncbi:phosphatase [Legionella lansingensis]|uniref:Phosphatase n=1 Tax=Legionella lansingensis TaxID=45067 RepID=A0A0W0VV02_9GAMM|nr:phosphatase [Legionella lansingensis]SNV46657.1 phosphatase [Legionella lansingensis]
MLFSVSGRESDLGFSSNPDKYREYRKKCAEQFIQYAKELKMNATDIKNYSQLILYMGNPDFLKEYSHSPEMINLYHIMNLAHKLDLMRCYHLPQYERALKAGHDPLVVPSEEQQQGFNNVLKMVSDRITATGDRQYCVFDKDKGRVIQSTRDYDKKVFVKANTDPEECLRLCIEASNTATLAAEAKEQQVTSLPIIPTEELQYYFLPILDHLNRNLGKLGIKELDNLDSSYSVSKITQQGETFTVIAETNYNDKPTKNITITSVQLNEIIRKIDPAKLPLIFDPISVAEYISKNIGHLNISALDKIDSSYLIQKIETTSNPNEFKLTAESPYMNSGRVEVTLSISELRQTVQRIHNNAAIYVVQTTHSFDEKQTLTYTF